MTRVVVTGGRKYLLESTVWRVLDAVNRRLGIATLIHGAAPGLDTLAEEWACARRIPCLRYRVRAADWQRLGGRAGMRRNQRMIDEARPELGIVFPGGAGTRDMATRIKAAGIPLLRVPRVDLPMPRPACETCDDQGWHMDMRCYGGPPVEVRVTCVDCGGSRAGEPIHDWW